MWDSWYLIKILLLYWRTSKLTWSPNRAGFCMLSELLYSDYIYLYYPPSQEWFLFLSSYCFFLSFFCGMPVRFVSASTILAFFSYFFLRNTMNIHLLSKADANNFFFIFIFFTSSTSLDINQWFVRLKSSSVFWFSNLILFFSLHSSVESQTHTKKIPKLY